MHIALVQKLFRYDQWANQEVLTCLRKLSSPPERSLKFFAHVVAVEWLWLDRIQKSRSKMPVWPAMALDESERQLQASRKAWNTYLRNLTTEGLAQQVQYVNSKGESWQNAVADILLQVIFHSVGHRGQIASDLRLSGYEPPYTDFIHAVREGFLF
jgi:uncharacterized damage-inducible protein DinB